MPLKVRPPKDIWDNDRMVSSWIKQKESEKDPYTIIEKRF